MIDDLIDEQMRMLQRRMTNWVFPHFSQLGQIQFNITFFVVGSDQ